MKIYLDICAIQRPLDTQNQVRIILESEAVLGIISLCNAGQIELLSSEVLAYEVAQNLLAIRREHSNAVLSKARDFIHVTEKVQHRAESLMKYGIKPLDALHIASAESGNADYFCTCDDRLLRNANQIDDLLVKVLNPVELVQEIEK